MKTLSLSLFASLAVSTTLPATTWEWTLDNSGSAAAIGDGILDWSTPNALTLATFAVTDGTTIPHIGGSPATYVRIPAYSDPADFPQLTFNGSAANGGGAYINQYTVIMDVYVPGPHAWLPFFNTNPANANDADFYVSPAGALGIGALGYTSDGAVTTDAWHRIVFAADLTFGVVTYYIDGAQVFQRQPDATSLIDGRFSIYSAVDAGIDLILGNEGDTSGIYTREWLLAAFAFVDHTLTADEATQLGASKAAGIYFTGTPSAPPRLTATRSAPNVITVDWDQQGFLLQRSTDLSSWAPISGSTGVKTYSEPMNGSRTFFRLANP
ncbi:MAG TPA: hypothetical protein VHM91_09100 [Verrucomicrobiales bacterium]|jgi:hypothetical protein|nr:hypothetical protein [Verrucomicrobiales bacterium]